MPGLVAGLDALIVALLLLGAMFAVSTIFRPLLVNVLAQAPFIGGWLASNVDSGLANFQRAITGPANASLYLVSSTLDWLNVQGRAFVQALLDFGGALVWSSWVIATVTIPDAASKTLQQAENLFRQAEADAQAIVAAARTDLQQEMAVAGQLEASIVAAARSDLESEISAAETVVLLEIRKAEQATGDLFQQAEYDAGQAVAASEVRLGALVQQARAQLGETIGTIQRELAAVADQTEAQLPEALRNLGKDLSALGEQVAAQGPEAQRNLDKEIADLKASTPWQLIANLEAEGENLIGTALSDLVKVERTALSAEIAGAKALQARLAPFVRGVTAQVRGR